MEEPKVCSQHILDGSCSQVHVIRSSQLGDLPWQQTKPQTSSFCFISSWNSECSQSKFQHSGVSLLNRKYCSDNSILWHLFSLSRDLSPWLGYTQERKCDLSSSQTNPGHFPLLAPSSPVPTSAQPGLAQARQDAMKVPKSVGLVSCSPLCPSAAAPQPCHEHSKSPKIFLDELGLGPRLHSVILGVFPNLEENRALPHLPNHNSQGNQALDTSAATAINEFDYIQQRMRL